jgi:formylglycine-generating enzyme required for sulfatase activity
MDCLGNRCVPLPKVDIVCPDDMVKVADAYCIDRFEASRIDATESSPGVTDARALSRPDVLPWQLDHASENDTARNACLAVGKDLCTPQQWMLACQGPGKTVYGYGDAYEPSTCNGIDLFGIPGFRVLPTGSLPGCVNGWGAYDMNGNVWEHTLEGSARTVRGGAYNCSDSQALHRCDYVPSSWSPSARGFRCCLVPDGSPDAGLDDAGTDAPDDVVASDVEDDMSCIEEDAGDGSADVQQEVSQPDAGPDAEQDADQDAGPDATSDAEPDAAPDSGPDASIDAAPKSCPADMVRVKAASLDVCMDLYEASRSDATAVYQGQSAMASSRSGVLPWFPVNLPTARSACLAAGKRLCQLDESVQGCEGASKTVYSYGNSYDPIICNGIDTFCHCGSGSCASLSVCPYPHCFSQASSEGGGPCGAAFQAKPTGSFPNCTSSYGAFDVTGNVWELADSNDGLEHFRGGAYNCGNSEALHRCDHDGTWSPTAKGFRCCKDPE